MLFFVGYFVIAVTRLLTLISKIGKLIIFKLELFKAKQGYPLCYKFTYSIL